jgi:hypothetical protein
VKVKHDNRHDSLYSTRNFKFQQILWLLKGYQYENTSIGKCRPTWLYTGGIGLLLLLLAFLNVSDKRKKTQKKNHLRLHTTSTGSFSLESLL